MKRPDALRKIGDAVDLLTMLEQLTSGFLNQTQGTREAPWAGLRLSLSHARDLLTSAREQLLTDAALPESALTFPPEKSGVPIGTKAGVTLADRVMQSPVVSAGGRTRELLGGMHAGGINRVEEPEVRQSFAERGKY